MERDIKNPLPRPTHCNVCNSQSIRLTQNSVLYGRNYGKWPLIWFCNVCKSAVGCHPDTDIPLGLMADQPTRQARKLAHDAFDPLWRDRKIFKRGKAYTWLAKQMQLTVDKCHISQFNIEQCNEVISICTNFTPSKVKKYESTSNF